MKTLHCLIQLVIVSLLVHGCASSEQKPDALAAYLGKHIDEASEALGRPSSIYNMQNGTWDVVWTETVGSSGRSVTFMGVQVAEGDARECNRVLVINRDKIVIDYKYEGSCKH